MKVLHLFLALLVTVASMAQDSVTSSPTITNEALGAEIYAGEIPNSFKDKFAYVQSYKDSFPEDSIKLSMEVFRFTFNQNKKVFQWQYISSIIIFFVVVLIVLTGLFLSYLQFKKSAESNTKLEIGSSGIKIDTAVIGLAILTLSLSFLFLYLKYVYPISIVKIK